MKVPDRLAGAIAVVDHDSEVLSVARLGGDPTADAEQVPGERRIVQFRERRHVAARHDEHVERRLRIQVGERDGLLVLIHELRRDLARDDAAEDAVAHGRENSDVTLAAIAITYLASSLSFPWLIARLYGVDLRQVGARKLGGSNLGKTVGLWQGIAGGVLDGAKGFAAVLVTRGLGLPPETQLLCGIAAVIGQMWPIFHGFDGGRANATGWGFAVAADPIAALIMGSPIYAALAANAVVRPRPTRLLPIAGLLSFAIFPAVIWEQEGVTPTVLAGLVVLALVVIRRITAGLRDDLATGAPLSRIIANRTLFDRSELQQRGVVAI